MFGKVLITALLISNAFNIISALYKYSMALQDEEIFVPCKIPGVYFFDRFFDISDLKFEFLANYSVHMRGSASWIRDLGTDNLGENRFSVETYKKDRDRWSPTIYNIIRPDYCQSLFNPTDLWFPYFKNVSKENRKCPFFVGQNFTFDLVADFSINLPNPTLAGNYMDVIMVHFKGVNEYLCANIFFEVYRN